MEPVGDVLDQGRERGSRGRTAQIAATAVIAAGLVGAAVVASVTWWASRPPTSDRLEIADASVVGQSRVTIVAEAPIGALATPAGAALPGITLRLTVGGDPGDSVEVEASRMDALVYVEDRESVVLPPGGFADFDVTIAPVDCALAQQGTDPDEAGYLWRRPFGIEILATTSGTTVPMSEDAQATLRQALTEACAEAGTAPQLEITAARRGGERPLETIGLVVDVSTEADRFVLTPLDGPGLRGLGAADRRSGEGIPLLWLVSPQAEQNDDVSTAYTQVFIVRDGTAYPWIIGTPITDDLPEMTPLTTSIR